VVSLVDQDFYHTNLDDILWRRRRWNGSMAYGESKLHDVLRAFAVARLWPDVRSNALESGWVPTRQDGRPGSPRRYRPGASNTGMARDERRCRGPTTAGYVYHRKPREPNEEVRDVALQDRPLDICQEISGVDLTG
jgi:hypothetical protein